MNNCYRCIMEHADGLVLIKPTIYIIEGDYHNTEHNHAKDDESEQECEEADDRPF